jgi:hypothetical protein
MTQQQAETELKKLVKEHCTCGYNQHIWGRYHRSECSYRRQLFSTYAYLRKFATPFYPIVWKAAA